MWKKPKVWLVIALVVIASVAVARCTGEHEVVKIAKRMADKVCACKDDTCASQALAAGMRELMQHGDAEGTEADAEAVKEATQRALVCRATFELE